MPYHERQNSNRQAQFHREAIPYLMAFLWSRTTFPHSMCAVWMLLLHYARLWAHVEQGPLLRHLSPFSNPWVLCRGSGCSLKGSEEKLSKSSGTVSQLRGNANPCPISRTHMVGEISTCVQYACICVCSVHVPIHIREEIILTSLKEMSSEHW